MNPLLPVIKLVFIVGAAAGAAAGTAATLTTQGVFRFFAKRKNANKQPAPEAEAADPPAEEEADKNAQ